MRAVLDAGEFKRIIENTKKFVRKEARNDLMSWIYMEIDAKEMTIKATALDGRRVSTESAGLTEADESFVCFIRPEIPKVSRYDAYAELEVNENRLFVRVGESIAGYVQPEGTFYDVSKVLEPLREKEKMAVIGMNAKYLKGAMESISAYGGSKMCKIEVYGPLQPIVIRPVRKGERENVKIVLPIDIRD